MCELLQRRHWLTRVAENIEVYNILADSIGMVPKPNNGTLRLPLKPVGQHRPEDTPEVPADPPQSSETHSPSDAPLRPTHPGQLTVIERPTPPGQPTISERPTIPAKPTKTEEKLGETPPPSNDDKGTDDDDDDDDGLVGKVKGFWDWFTGKVEHLWDKIAGSKSDEDGESG